MVLITILAPGSGAHLDPAVAAVLTLRGEFPAREFAPYVGAQCLGGVAGTAVAHVMFGLAPLAIGDHARTGAGQ